VIVDFIVLANNQRRLPSGVFVDGGNWICIKCFHPAGEFYVNINLPARKLEIAPKDIAYKDGLLRAFERMLSFKDEERRAEA